MSGPEENLVRRAAGGDTEALGELLERNAPQVRRELTVEAQWLSKFDLDDVMQVTFLEAFLHIRRFDPERRGAFGGWLLRIARNNLRDLIKEAGRGKRPPPNKQLHRPAHGDSYLSLVEVLCGTSGATPSRHAAGHEAKQTLDAAIALLPEVYRQVVRMFDLEGRSAAEVGAAIGRSAGAVYMLRGRAHDRLLEILGSESRFFSHRA